MPVARRSARPFGLVVVRGHRGRGGRDRPARPDGVDEGIGDARADGPLDDSEAATARIRPERGDDASSIVRPV